MSLWSHIRHSRGYGIHSPLVYRLVREVTMHRRIDCAEHDLYDALRASGIGRRTAVSLQNYFAWAECNIWAIDFVSNEHCVDGALLIFTPEAVGEAETAVKSIGNKRVTLCVLSPRKCRVAIDRMVNMHNNISVENRRFAIFFYGGKRPKQHILI